jgi:hypothetical protein
MIGAGFFESRAATRVPVNATSTQFAVLALRELFRHNVMPSWFHDMLFRYSAVSSTV